MKCEEVRSRLPELAEGTLREAGPVEQHLVSCSSCASEFDRYRSLMRDLDALKDVLVEPPPGFLDRILVGTPAAYRRPLVHRVVGDDRFQYAALSLGGAVVGATAIGLLWWRAARRSMTGPPGRNGERLAPAD